MLVSVLYSKVSHEMLSNAATLTEVFPCFFLGCKANARVILAKTGHGPHSSKTVVLLYVLFVLYCSMYCLCVNVYCHRVTTQLQLTNISHHINHLFVLFVFVSQLSCLLSFVFCVYILRCFCYWPPGC